LKNTIFYSIVGINYTFSFIILKNLIPITGYFIPGMMGFVFTASLIFLLFEKKIILGFKRNFYNSLLFSIPVTILYLTTIFQINLFNTFFVFVSLFVSYRVSDKKIFSKENIFSNLFNFISFAIISLLIFKISSKYFLYFISFFIIQTFTIYLIKRLYRRDLSSPDFIFYPNLIAAIVLTILYFLNKPLKTPEVSHLNQVYLSVYIFVANFLNSFLLIKKEKHKLSKLNKEFVLFLCLTFLLILTFSFFNLLILILLLIPTITSFKVSRKGFGVSETIALVTMVAILISLLLPTIKVLSNKMVVIQDCENLNNNRNSLKDVYVIDNIYIKFIDKKPVAIYSKIKDRYRYFFTQ